MRLETTFYPIPPSDQLKASVQTRARALKASHTEITACQVAVLAPAWTEPGSWKVDVQLTVDAGSRVRRGPHRRCEDRDVYVALSAAFQGVESVLSQPGVSNGRPH